MSEQVTEAILEQVRALPYAEQRRVLDFARALGQARPTGVGWVELSRFAGSIDKKDLRTMADAIEQGCARIDLNEW